LHLASVFLATLATFLILLVPKLKQENHQQRSKSANQDFRQSSSFDSYQSLCIILFCTFAPLTLKKPFFSKGLLKSPFSQKINALIRGMEIDLPMRASGVIK
jgi:hypothetical protein